MTAPPTPPDLDAQAPRPTARQGDSAGTDGGPDGLVADGLAVDELVADGLVVDVLVVGGGLVGGPLAAALSQGGLSVAVIDAADPAAVLAAEFDGRASAIALGSQRVLAAIGLWPAIAPEAQAIEEIRVSDGALSRGDSPMLSKASASAGALR